MFLILNRLRGTYSWFAKVNGVVLGLLVYIVFGNLYVSLVVTIGYVLGSSLMAYRKLISYTFDVFEF